ncbi:MAG: hypothetical protein ACK2UB_02525 [Anaerolineales bacterium]
MSTQGASGTKPPVDKVKTRKLMRFWAIGTFIIVFAAMTTYASFWTGFLIFLEPLYWIAIILFAAATAAVLLIHEWWLRRQ